MLMFAELSGQQQGNSAQQLLVIGPAFATFSGSPLTSASRLT